MNRLIKTILKNLPGNGLPGRTLYLEK